MHEGNYITHSMYCHSVNANSLGSDTIISFHIMCAGIYIHAIRPTQWRESSFTNSLGSDTGTPFHVPIVRLREFISTQSTLTQMRERYLTNSLSDAIISVHRMCAGIQIHAICPTQSREPQPNSL